MLPQAQALNCAVMRHTNWLLHCLLDDVLDHVVVFVSHTGIARSMSSLMLCSRGTPLKLLNGEIRISSWYLKCSDPSHGHLQSHLAQSLKSWYAAMCSVTSTTVSSDFCLCIAVVCGWCCFMQWRVFRWEWECLFQFFWHFSVFYLLQNSWFCSHSGTIFLLHWK